MCRFSVKIPCVHGRSGPARLVISRATVLFFIPSPQLVEISTSLMSSIFIETNRRSRRCWIVPFYSWRSCRGSFYKRNHQKKNPLDKRHESVDLGGHHQLTRLPHISFFCLSCTCMYIDLSIESTQEFIHPSLRSIHHISPFGSPHRACAYLQVILDLRLSDHRIYIDYALCRSVIALQPEVLFIAKGGYNV